MNSEFEEEVVICKGLRLDGHYLNGNFKIASTLLSVYKICYFDLIRSKISKYIGYQYQQIFWGNWFGYKPEIYRWAYRNVYNCLIGLTLSHHCLGPTESLL